MQSQLEARRRERNARRDRLTFLTDGGALKAEQTIAATFHRPPPLQPLRIEANVRVLIPRGDNANMGTTISGGFTVGDVRDEDHDALCGQIFQGGRRGSSNIPHPLPQGGYQVEVVGLRLTPPLGEDATRDDIARLGELFEHLIAGAVAGCLGGIIATWQQARHLKRARQAAPAQPVATALASKGAT